MITRDAIFSLHVVCLSFGDCPVCASKNGDWSVCGCKIQTILVTYLNVLHLIFDSEICEETRESVGVKGHAELVR